MIYWRCEKMIQKENSFGTFDQEINAFFKDAHHFACLINTCLYQGQEIVKPQDLMLVDPKIQPIQGMY